MTWLTVFVGIIAFSNLILLVGLAFLAFTVKKLLDNSVQPVLSEVKSTINNVNSMVDKVENKAERIMEISEDTARKVSGRVVATTNIVQESITTPLINISSVLTGISKAITVLRGQSARS
ncbi:MAG: hypothetical protein ACYC27_18350 [Armatimonadota bacterium]